MSNATPAPADWAAARALFDRLLPLSASERAAALADPALPPALRDEVQSLLAHESSSPTGFLSAARAAPEPPRPINRLGQRLGAWRVIQPLGSGGMGEVFEAQRDDGRYQGRAAIKLLKRGMDSQAVLSRFAQEQQALARLAHPHIARLLDAGVSGEGLPYFVMELVRGRPVDQACEGQPLAERLRLFLQLADAVAHAHRNLLVHRDLKPSNVMVDEEGRVKLLDFGIAKALDPLEGRPDATGTMAGERPFTPHYASPEQVRGEPVSTATDIYSLGVLLFVMLTGQRPYGRKALTAAEAARSVLEEEPTRASTVASVEPGWERTRRQLQGDLDNILLKTLAKAPAERYASVDALAADVHAYLDGRPVSARRASPGYVLAKWLGRHRAAALAATLGALGLLSGLAATLLQGRVVLALGALGMAAGLVLALVQARRAQLARDEAARSRDDAARHVVELRRLANRMVFDVNDALERGLTDGRRQLVHAAAQSLERQAGFGQMSDPERVELATALTRLARLEGHEFTNNLGNVPGALQRYDQALHVLELLAARQQDNAEWHGAMAGALEGRAAVLRTLLQCEEAQTSIARGAHHAARAAALAPEDMRWRALEYQTLAFMTDNAYPVVRFQGLVRLDDARQHLVAALAASQRLMDWAPKHMRALRLRASALRYETAHLAIEGRLDEALVVDDRGWAVLQHAFAAEDGDVARASDLVPSRIRTAITRRAAGRYNEASQAIAESLAHARRALNLDRADENLPRHLIASVQTTMDLLLHGEDPGPAEALYDEATPLLPPAPLGDPLQKRHWDLVWMDSLLAVACVRNGHADRAQPLAQRLRRVMEDDSLNLVEPVRALDAELAANIHIARAYAAAAVDAWDDVADACTAAKQQLAHMRALRDPRDAIEAIRAWQLTVRLARAPFGVTLPGAALANGLRAHAREMERELLARAFIRPGTYAESLWLATQPD